MKINLANLKKSEIIKMSKMRCKHGHRYTEHLNCYIEEQMGKGPKVGFLDIETSNLSADFGIMFTYVIKVLDADEYYTHLITPQELQSTLDRKVVTQLAEDIQRFDLLVTYYGTKFDIPFARTRAVNLGIEFPDFGSIQHKDAYYIVRNKFRLSRNRLENASRILIGKTEKTHMAPEEWIRALMGDEKSLAYIQDHCIKDVKDLEKLYKKVIPFVQNSTRSI